MPLKSTYSLAEARISQSIFGDITFMGLRSAIGVIFIVHGVGKLNEGFLGFLTGAVGFPAEMQIPIALAEIVPGILLIVGFLTRISSSLLAIIDLGAIFHVKQAANLTGHVITSYSIHYTKLYELQAMKMKFE